MAGRNRDVLMPRDLEETTWRGNIRHPAQKIVPLNYHYNTIILFVK